MEAILSWILRGTVLAVGVGMAVLLVRWLTIARRTAEERWPLHLAFGKLGLAVIYAIGHGRMLLDAEAQFSGVDVQTVISRLLDAVAPPTDRVGA